MNGSVWIKHKNLVDIDVDNIKIASCQVNVNLKHSDKIIFCSLMLTVFIP